MVHRRALHLPDEIIRNASSLMMYQGWNMNLPSSYLLVRSEFAIEVIIRFD
jgi:hypothetical protein